MTDLEKLERAKSVIANLLVRIDGYESDMHLKGMTPDWYVYAACVSADIDVEGDMDAPPTSYIDREDAILEVVFEKD